ncbi:hypothetical protein RY831_08415 [Noviherbaspirillum sp. CPCC 100848]|uniref:Uncharacterized protein n=1 Tax=Noviherbaspirillum album TaxID=3080276 RepID=A0ABU6J692_9BURK|nr:hypothetical protein [Noviherbaspirillum sp. CPCC 100848]MEC4719168.1 hypothetical protein [Noviherbaspirillum sp. CPCC 100848]
MDFFVWQGAGGIHSGAMDDERNAAWREKRYLMPWNGMAWDWYKGASAYAEAKNTA